MEARGCNLIVELEGLMLTSESCTISCFPSQELEGGDLGILEIQLDEVRKVVGQAKNGKAPGSDQVPAELIKLLDEHGMNKLAELYASLSSDRGTDYRVDAVPFWNDSEGTAC